VARLEELREGREGREGREEVSVERVGALCFPILHVERATHKRHLQMLLLQTLGRVQLAYPLRVGSWRPAQL